MAFLDQVSDHVVVTDAIDVIAAMIVVRSQVMMTDYRECARMAGPKAQRRWLHLN